jgi:hypothetical protein
MNQDKLDPCITTSVHDEVYMWSSLSWFIHYYFSSWWGVHVIKFASPWTEVVMYEPGQTLSHVHLIMNWSSNAWTRTNLITCTSVHGEVYMCSCITTSVHGEVYMCSCITTSVHGEVYMCSYITMNQDKLYHMYTSPWTEVVMYEPGQTLSHVHLIMNW